MDKVGDLAAEMVDSFESSAPEGSNYRYHADRSRFTDQPKGAAPESAHPVSLGILSTWSDINPCSLDLRALAVEAKIGIIEAGGVPFEFPLMSISENIIKPTSFPFRNLLAMEAEETIRAYPFDAVVLLGGCDKTQPGLLMGAASAGVPFIYLASGPATPRSSIGGDLAYATGAGGSWTNCARASCRKETSLRSSARSWARPRQWRSFARRSVSPCRQQPCPCDRSPADGPCARGWPPQRPDRRRLTVASGSMCRSSRCCFQSDRKSSQNDADP